VGGRTRPAPDQLATLVEPLRLHNLRSWRLLAIKLLTSTRSAVASNEYTNMSDIQDVSAYIKV
jgi:hypothetical protein